MSGKQLSAEGAEMVCLPAFPQEQANSPTSHKGFFSSQIQTIKVKPVFPRGNSESQEKRELKRAVDELLKTAGEENWDGEDALAVTQQTADFAKELVEMFPESIVLPEVSASPQGEVNFDWFVSRDIMLTICVCPTGQVAYVGIFNQERIKETNDWAEGLPLHVANWLENLKEQEQGTGAYADIHDVARSNEFDSESCGNVPETLHLKEFSVCFWPFSVPGQSFSGVVLQGRRTTSQSNTRCLAVLRHEQPVRVWEPRASFPRASGSVASDNRHQWMQ